MSGDTRKGEGGIGYPEPKMPETSGDTRRAARPRGATAAVWIELAGADRDSLRELGGQVGLPLELVTYCLLAQRRPMVVPCGAWLYSVWQVPVTARKPSAGGDDVFCRFVELKACLGPAALVTTQGRVGRANGRLAGLVAGGDALVRDRPGDLLVTLVERVSDAYVAAYGALTVGRTVESDGRTRGGRQPRSTAGTQLLRHARAHRDAVQRLVVRGRRWLDGGDVERLRHVVDRLAAVGGDPSRLAEHGIVVRCAEDRGGSRRARASATEQTLGDRPTVPAATVTADTKRSWRTRG